MYKILIIEDEAINQLILQQSLERQGYEVAIASDGAAGLTLAQDFNPALIICDWMMPQMSGLEVCHRVKADRYLANIFFILLTARTDIKDRIEGLDSGADDFLSKPIQPNELLARVRAGLRIYQSAQALRQLTEALQTQQQHLEAELAQAASYVTSLLPKPLSGKVHIDAQFLPSQQLGGDCFDFYWLDDDHLVLYVLDVSGHGLGAALPSVSMQQVLRSQSLPNANFYEPSSVLVALNQIFQMSTQNPRFFTLWYGVYRHSRRTLDYASAGHPPAILVAPSGDIQCLGQAGQLPVGVFADSAYASDQHTIQPGSILYSFSDGLYEIQQAEGELWTYEGLSQVLSQLHRSGSVTLNTIFETIHDLNARETFEDDCSIIQARF
ncbi:MAG: SpoIIE family protein phosphatase [Cyanobacteria bacterium J06635_1]